MHPCMDQLNMKCMAHGVLSNLFFSLFSRSCLSTKWANRLFQLDFDYITILKRVKFWLTGQKINRLNSKTEIGHRRGQK